MLWELRDGELLRFRCPVGHADTGDVLLSDQVDTIERALWTALGALEEQGSLKRRMAERARLRGNATTAARYEHRARDLNDQAEQVRSLLLAAVGVERK